MTIICAFLKLSTACLLLLSKPQTNSTDLAIVWYLLSRGKTFSDWCFVPHFELGSDEKSTCSPTLVLRRQSFYALALQDRCRAKGWDLS